MTLPWRSMTAAAVVAAYFATTRKQGAGVFSFLGSFVGVWLAQFLVWAFWKVILYPKVFSSLRGLPEPEGNSWFNGQFAAISGNPTGVPMRKWANTIPNKGLIRYKGLFNQERVLVTSAEGIKDVLVTKCYDFLKPYQVRFTLGRILGVGILLAEGDEHRLQRRNLMPAFSFRHIKNLYPVFWDKGREGVQALTAQVLSDAAKTPSSQDPEKATELDGKTTAVVEVGSWASRMTLDIVGVAGLGRDFRAIQDPANSLYKTYNHLFKPSRQAQLLTLAGVVLPGWLIALIPVKRNEDIAAAAKVIRSTCRDLIREKKGKLERKELTDLDILSVALESGGFTEENLVDQLMTFLAAGHETTASAMTWAVYMLSKNPEIQTRLREEVRSKLPSLNDPATISSMDIDHMPYLNAVCSEVLRYWSPVPMVMRETGADTILEGQRIPKGTRIILSPAATNRDSHLWGPDAGTFNPDRWIPTSAGDKQAANGGAPSPYAFLTFLHGPRGCIGVSFAKAEFACLLAAWIGRFEFSLKNKEEMDETNMAIKGGVTARPAKGLYVYAKVLEGW